MAFNSQSSTGSSNSSASTIRLDRFSSVLPPPSPPRGPWAPGVSDRSLRHQRDVGFVYNEDYDEAELNDPDERPDQYELVFLWDRALVELQERESEQPGWRDEFWERVARGDFLLQGVRYSKWTRMRMEEEAEREETESQWDESEGETAVEDDSEAGGWETARLVGDGEGDEQQQQKGEIDDDTEPNWKSLGDEMEATEFV